MPLRIEPLNISSFQYLELYYYKIGNTFMLKMKWRLQNRQLKFWRILKPAWPQAVTPAIEGRAVSSNVFCTSNEDILLGQRMNGFHIFCTYSTSCSYPTFQTIYISQNGFADSPWTMRV